MGITFRTFKDGDIGKISKALFKYVFPFSSVPAKVLSAYWSKSGQSSAYSGLKSYCWNKSF